MNNKKVMAVLLTAAMGLSTAVTAAASEPEYTFSLFVDSNFDENKQPVAWPYLEEQTGIRAQLECYPYEIASEKYSLALGSGDYADCIGGWCLSEKDVLNYGVDMGIFVPLEDYFKDCPNISAVLDLPGVREAMTAPDGHIYSIPYAIEAPLIDYNPYINTRWLENVGMEMPTTTEELREVLRAFKEQDANGNGDPTDEVPFSGGKENLHLGYLAGWFGMSLSKEGFTMDGDQLVFGAQSEAYKEGMKYLASLYAEGLIDPEMFTQDKSMWTSKGGNDTYGVSIMYYSQDIMKVNAGEMPEWAPLPVLKSENCENPVWLKNTLGTDVLHNQVVITDAAEHPELICKWWDNVFSLENYVLTQKGDDKMVTKDGDDYIVTDITTLSDEDQEKYQWGNLYPQSLPKYAPAGFRFKEDPMPYDECKARDEAYGPYLTENIIPKTWPDLDTSEELTELQTSITDYITQCQAQWVAGQADIEADWEGYKDQLNKLGLERYLELKGATLAE